jgi:hypothetical protein
MSEKKTNDLRSDFCGQKVRKIAQFSEEWQSIWRQLHGEDAEMSE